MKKLGISTILFLLSLLWVQAQTYTVNVSGTVTETGTGLPVANHAVDIWIDSTFIGFSYYNTVTTNAAGQYTDAITVPGTVMQGTGGTGTRDCTPAGYNINSFTFSSNASNIGNLDFQICVNTPGSCSAAFAYTTSGNTASFNDLSSGAGVAINSWQWSFGDGTTSSQQNPSHTYSVAGVYPVCLTITTGTGCTDTYCDSLMVGGSSISCNATLSSTVSPSGPVTFNATGTGTGAPVAYFFDFGDGNTMSSASNVVTHNYASPGTYNACVFIDFSDSCRASSCTSVQVGNTLPCQAGFYWFPDSSGQYSIIVVNTSTGNNLSYNWTFGDGTSSTQAYPQHTYAGPGTYVVCVTVTSQNPGCTSTFCDSLTVINKVSTPFTINVVGSNATAVEPVAAAAQASFFPNPARDFFMVDLNLEQNEMVDLQIVDLSGRQLKASSFGNLQAGAHQLKMETSDLAAGLYLVRLKTGEASLSHKLMITK